MPLSSDPYHRLRVPEHVADMIRGMHPELKRKVRSALKLILKNPSSGKPLKEKLIGLNSYRIGRIRIIYRPVARHVIEIVTVGPRKSIYRETYRLVKKGQRNEFKWGTGIAAYGTKGRCWLIELVRRFHYAACLIFLKYRHLKRTSARCDNSISFIYYPDSWQPAKPTHIYPIIMKLETEIKKIEALSEQNQEANWKFRSFLKGYDAPIERIDTIVHELYEWISSEIDCTTCANCCRKIRPVLDQKDVRRLANALKISFSDFKAMYLSTDENPEGFVLRQTPCPFLKSNLCAHYDFRPIACRSFPHLHKKEFIFRLWNVVQNCSVCPIVFNVYEHLKEELWHIDYNNFDF